MAKKINFKTIQEVDRASNVLRDFHIEHVLVKYPLHPKGNDTDKTNHYIVVLNRLLSDAKTAFETANLTPSRIKNQRHYERVAAAHKHFKS